MTSNINQKVNALLNAFDSDESIGSIVDALGDPVREIRETAYWLLTETKNEAAKQALRSYPYAQMQLLHAIAGCSPRKTNYFAISTGKKVLLSNCHSEATKGYAIATINIWNLLSRRINGYAVCDTRTYGYWPRWANYRFKFPAHRRGIRKLGNETSTLEPYIT